MPRVGPGLRPGLPAASAYRRSSEPRPPGRCARTRRPSCDRPELQRAGEGAAVEQNVLPGDEAGLGAAQERAGLAEFVGLAEAARRIELGAFGQHLLDVHAALFG